MLEEIGYGGDLEAHGALETGGPLESTGISGPRLRTVPPCHTCCYMVPCYFFVSELAFANHTL
eukprot:6464683-Pyramimonas_sp.AAC.1